MRMRNPKYMNEVIANCPFLVKDNLDFPKDYPIHLEIGMGKGNFLLQMALEYPEINFVGVEKYSSVASVAIKKIMDYDLPNLKVIIGDILDVQEILQKKVEVIYLNFSDPWPKKRHSKRRLTAEEFLKTYDKIFKDKKMIIMKTDNDDLFLYSKESLENYGYQIIDISYDLHQTDIPNIMTEYEEKFSNMGIKIKYLKAIK